MAKPSPEPTDQEQLSSLINLLAKKTAKDFLSRHRLEKMPTSSDNDNS